MQTDPIADFLTRIRNALTADQDEAVMPASKFKAELARILREQGYIEEFSVEPARVGQELRVRLKYTEDRRSVIQGLERISKPGRREYVNADSVPKVQGGMGTTIISTSRGVMTGHDARRARVGGELVANMVQGVTDGFEKRLEIQGVGYRARLQGKALELSVGYSHPVSVGAPEGIEFEVPQPTRIAVRGSSKQAVGEVAARIRKVRPPEPYKGKGIRYEGEYVQRKVGKRA